MPNWVLSFVLDIDSRIINNEIEKLSFGSTQPNKGELSRSHKT